MAADSITLKITVVDSGNIVRLRVERDLNLQKILVAVRSAFGTQDVSLKYKDDEDDLCTLSEETFRDFEELHDPRGRSMVRLFLTAPTSMPLAQLAPASSGACHENPACKGPQGLFDLLKMGLHLFQAPAGGWEEGSKGGWKGGWKGGCKGGHGWHLKKKMYFTLARLHGADCLNARSVAALAAHSLPELLSHATDHVGQIAMKMKRKLPKLRPVLEGLCPLVVSTPGLEHCEPKIKEFLMSEDLSGGDVLLTLLTALSSLTFEAQIAFFEALYESQEERLLEALAWSEQWVPKAPMEHHGIACDGCEMRPLQGLRFKCKTCPDYDLCAECFGNKGLVHGGDSSAHEFELIGHLPWMMAKGFHHMMGAKGKGKRKGKGKGKDEDDPKKEPCGGKGRCKGMGKFRGKRSADESGGEASPTKRPCARAGCGFAATWHKTHCCARCVRTGEHGPRCEQQPMPVAPEADKPSSDLTFPVVVEDGRNLSISWGLEDDLAQVATAFALQHGIPPEELPTIAAFLHERTAAARLARADAGKGGEEPLEEQAERLRELSLRAEAAPPADAAPAVAAAWPGEGGDDALEAQAEKLEAMGLGSAEVLLALLREHGGSVRRVVEVLLEG